MTPGPAKSTASEHRDEQLLRRITRWRKPRGYDPPLLGDEALAVLPTLQMRASKFGKLSQAWDQLVPRLLAEHAYLASFRRGALTVFVDSSPHLYELRVLLSAGLQDQLLAACYQDGLRRINLKRGQPPTS